MPHEDSECSDSADLQLQLDNSFEVPSAADCDDNHFLEKVTRFLEQEDLDTLVNISASSTARKKMGLWYQRVSNVQLPGCIM